MVCQWVFGVAWEEALFFGYVYYIPVYRYVFTLVPRISIVFYFFYSGDRKTFYIPFTSKTRHWFWILCGIFSGAAAAAAARFFRLEEFEGKTIVAVL